jgi:AcrR family transcriptional regulator
MKPTRTPGPRLRRRRGTQQGADTRAAILDAAQDLLREHWLDQLPLAQLSEKCGRARASILGQFPNGWPDILNTLAIRELCDIDTLWKEALALKRVGPVERVQHVLEPCLTRASETGLLYANLRAAMFTWGDENQAIFESGLQDIIRMIVECLVHPGPVPEGPAGDRVWLVAESLYYQALDLAARPWWMVGTWEERRATLEVLIETVVTGLALGAEGGKGKAGK